MAKTDFTFRHHRLVLVITEFSAFIIKYVLVILLYEVVGKTPDSDGDVASLAAKTSPVDYRTGAEAVGHDPET